MFSFILRLYLMKLLFHLHELKLPWLALKLRFAPEGSIAYFLILERQLTVTQELSGMLDNMKRYIKANSVKPL